MYNDFKNKKILIVGYSTTGVSSAKYFLKHNADVYITEFSKDKEIDNSLLEAGAHIELGKHSEDFIKGSSFAIVSPSIPKSAPIFNMLEKYNIEYMSDIEYCYRMFPEKLIVITGTNGKTTTTMLTSHILNAKYNTKACGNIGTSPFEYSDENLDYFVVEASSFQLEYSNSLTPKIGIFTNLTPDHLYFHHTLENYFEAKAKMFRKMDNSSFAILNVDDPMLKKLEGEINANIYSYSTKTTNARVKIVDNYLTIDENKIINIKDIPIKGEHNIQNVMAASSCALILGVNVSDIKNKIMEFKAPPHRLEFIRRIGKTSFYNDSKATNPEASNVALTSFKGQDVCLIAGGRDKNTPLDEFIINIHKFIKNVILIGEAKDRFDSELKNSGYNNILYANSLQDAIDKGIKLNPDVLLLSPACASFDMFKSFEERGDVFREYVLSK